MRADPTAQARLLDLQDLDNRLGRLARLERELPERAAADAVDARRRTARSDLAATIGALEDARLELRRVESDVAVVDARIASDEARLMTSTSTKDITGFEHELVSLRSRKAELEELQLAAMERVEEHEAAVAGLESTLAALDVEAADAQAAVTAAIERIAAERADASAARAALVAELPADLVELYERQRARYGVGASRLTRGVSEASGVALLADELASVRRAAPDDVIMCPSSEAILVRTAESGL